MDKEKIKQSVELFLEGIGEDVNREGILETPDRVMRATAEIFGGLGQDPKVHLSKTFPVDNSDMVIEKDIIFYSMCEHHLLPFYGKVHISYIPNGRVVGLSKLVRTVETFARRPQIQEQLTYQIAKAIEENLSCQGVFVTIEAEHMCMSMRGVNRPGTKTVTATALGVFEEDMELRNYALRLMGL